MGELLTPDICVIGAGSAGLAVATTAAAYGASVVVIEKNRIGGHRLNHSCVPSKALMAAANRAHQSATARPFGIDAPVTVDFAGVRQHIRKVMETVAPTISKERFAGLGVRILTGTGAFTDKRTVMVDSATTIRARRFVIATGSSPAIPPIPGFAEISYLTNETIFGLDALPTHLLVLGAGAIGLELAQAFRRLGAAVTVVEGARPLATEEPECAAIMLDALAREGITIRAEATVVAARPIPGGVELVVKRGDVEETVCGSHLLLAGARVPRIEGLGLEYARIKHGDGAIAVKRNLKTSNPRIYAVGEAAGAGRFSHVASHLAALVVRNALFRWPVDIRYNAIPRVIYTDPELAQVGLNDEEARKEGYTIRVLRWPYYENDRAQAERMTRGHVKVVTDKRGRILGATIVGAQAGELIAPWTLAMTEGLSIGAMARLLAPCPTLGEISGRAAMTYFSAIPESPMTRRFIRWVRAMG